MSAAEWEPRPYVVGEENVFMVGVQGIVESITAETITIEGTTLPRRMGGPIKYLSMVWPDEGGCDREHCGAECDPEPVDDGTREDLDTLAAMIRSAHEERHFSESMRFCNDPICREVHELDGAR